MQRTPKRVWLLLIPMLCGTFSAMRCQSASPSASEQSVSDAAKTPFTLKTSSRLVLVDVVATNGKGEPVTDLKAEDFVVSEDGRPQVVHNFSFQQPAAIASTPEIAEQKLQPPQSGVVSNIPHARKGVVWNVIVLDALNSPLLELSNTQDQLLQVLTKLPDQPAAIYVLGRELRLIQDFRSDPKALKQVLAQLKNKPSALLDNPKGGHEGERITPALWDVLPPSARAGILRSETAASASHMRNRLDLTLDALKAIAQSLKPLPGRKNLIWVSEGFPFSIEPGVTIKARDSVTGSDYTVAVASTANALFDSQIAIYPIDARGKLNPGVFDAAARGRDAIGRPDSVVGLESTLSEENNNLDVTHTSMQEVAERTGGKAFYNQNEIGKAIVDSMNDGATYYTLAYSPSNGNWNGKFRRISVKSARSGVKLRYRLGYFAMQPNAYPKRGEKQQASIFERAMDINSPASTAILFQAHIFPPSEKTQNQVVVNYSIAAAGLSFENSADQLQHASVNCAVEVYSIKGEPIKKDATTLTAALQPAVYNKIIRDGLPCQQKLALSPGDYIFRLGVRDNTTGMIGTVDTHVSIAALPPQTTKE
ncbi:MAG TPA: VWA domain-containing protein [Candidatus Angelobacter sp.]|jgi:VWFA-related protein